MNNRIQINTGFTNNNFLDINSRAKGLGGLNTSAATVLSGLNAIGGFPPLPHNTDTQGFTFFTRPCLNLSYNNVITQRKLTFLADYSDLSIGNAIRCLLDPNGFYKKEDTNRSKLIDDKCAFLPISNFLLTLSPPPDFALDVFTTNEGYMRQQISMVDSVPFNYQRFNLNAEFSNMEGDPISVIFMVWTFYMACVSSPGLLMPYPYFIASNRMDYNTRIFRIVTDRSNGFMQKIFSTRAFPLTDACGAPFGFTQGQHLNPASNQISCVFECNGAEYNDPILVKEFNQIVATFNPDMAPDSNGKIGSALVKVSGLNKLGLTEKAIFNYKLYPRINVYTNELEWYVNKEYYDYVTNSINSTLSDAPSTNSSTVNPHSNISTSQSSSSVKLD